MPLHFLSARLFPLPSFSFGRCALKMALKFFGLLVVANLKLTNEKWQKTKEKKERKKGSLKYISILALVKSMRCASVCQIQLEKYNKCSALPGQVNICVALETTTTTITTTTTTITSIDTHTLLGSPFLNIVFVCGSESKRKKHTKVMSQRQRTFLRQLEKYKCTLKQTKKAKKRRKRKFKMFRRFGAARWQV